MPGSLGSLEVRNRGAGLPYKRAALVVSFLRRSASTIVAYSIPTATLQQRRQAIESVQEHPVGS